MTEIKERPIICNATEVRAILDGSKTMTRRVVKHQPENNEYLLATLYDSTAKEDRKNIGKHRWASSDSLSSDYKLLKSEIKYFSAPCYEGDRLWVKETFTSTRDRETVLYKADELFIDLPRGDLGRDWNWTPSIFMPRWASRILLEVVSVKVERLQDISEEDAIKEGVALPKNTVTMYDGIYKDAFADLWDSINAKKGFGWDVNPWVWCIEFRRVE